MAATPKFFMILLALSLIVACPAKAEDMKNFTSEVLSAMKDSNPNSPLWMAGHKIIGWRFLDKNNQSLGKIADITLKAPEGDFETVQVATESLSFVKMLHFDVNANNVTIEDQVMLTDLDKGQIAGNINAFLGEETPVESTIRMTALLEAQVTLPDDTAIGRIKDTLSPVKTMKLRNLLVYLTGDRTIVAIPFAEVEIVERGGNLSVVVTPEQYKIMQKFAK